MDISGIAPFTAAAVQAADFPTRAVTMGGVPAVGLHYYF